MADATITIGVRHEVLDAYPDFATDFPDLPVPRFVVAPHPEIVAFEYEAQSVGVAAVADATDAEEEILLDFGDVDEALGFVLKNVSGQDLGVGFNGDGFSFSMPHGAVLACTLPAGATTPLTAISVFTTVEQAGDGAVQFKIFGSAAS